MADAIKELDLQTLVIFGNSDAGSKKIAKLINSTKIKKFLTIPYSDYINLLKNSSALVGNSSSGIIESPFLKIIFLGLLESVNSLYKLIYN